MRDLSIAERIRHAGLRCVETAGWQGRGSSSFAPRGSINHHTAGAKYGAAASLNGIIHGFPGSAPGPLAHVLQSREPDGNDIFYVVASGRANHAGKGGWRGLSGNTSVIGLEIEHTGKEPLAEHRQRLAARFHAAMARGRWAAPFVCQHREWAPNRKIDAATNVDPDQFRRWVQEHMSEGGRPGPEPSPEPPPVTTLVGAMFVLMDTNKRYTLYCAGHATEISSQHALQYAAMKIPFDDNAGKGYEPLVMVAHAQNVGVKF